MSKTISATYCETNQTVGLAQENVFFHSLYRLPAEYSQSFSRFAKSTSPIQICAVFSAQGNDNVAASALQKISQTFAQIVMDTQMQSFVDFEAFSTQVINVLNSTVCNISLEKGGTPLKISFTGIIIDGDIFRVLSIGNTRAYLVRKGKVIPLTEDQTVAHRYVQLGAISKEEEKTHPEKNELTQYLGRFPQDGPVAAEKKVHFKLVENDEIFISGTGVAHILSDSILQYILAQPNQPEFKAKELISAAMQSGSKGGLSAIILKVESVLVMSAGAVALKRSSAAVALNTVQSNGLRKSSNENEISNQPMQTNASNQFNQEVHYEPAVKDTGKRKKIIKAVGIPLSIFLACLLLGYGSAFLLFNAGNFGSNNETTISRSIDENVILNKVVYSISDFVPLYSEKSLESTIILSLARGEPVTLIEQDASFSKVMTTGGNTGYVTTIMLSETDPTVGESQPEMTGDPTPIPTYVTSASTTTQPTALTTAPSSAESSTTISEETTSSVSETSATITSETSETSATSETSTTSATSSSETTSGSSSSESSVESTAETVE